MMMKQREGYVTEVQEETSHLNAYALTKRAEVAQAAENEADARKQYYDDAFKFASGKVEMPMDYETRTDKDETKTQSHTVDGATMPTRLGRNPYTHPTSMAAMYCNVTGKKVDTEEDAVKAVVNHNQTVYLGVLAMQTQQRVY